MSDMLIRRNPKNGDVVVLMLVNGDEIIGYLTEDRESSYGLKKPMRMAILHTPEGPASTLTDFSQLGKADDYVSFPKEHVLTVLKPKPNVEKGYIEAASSIKVARGLPPKLDVS